MSGRRSKALRRKAKELGAVTKVSYRMTDGTLKVDPLSLRGVTAKLKKGTKHDSART